jgi:hypothetical protein
MKQLITRRAVTSAAVVVGAVLAVAVPAGAAVQVQSESPSGAVVNLRNTATLGARGAVITVPVVSICPAGVTATVGAEVTQRVGNGIAAGSAYESITCTGERQTTRLKVTASASGKPFKAGVAFGEAYLNFFDPRFGFVEVDDAHNITIVK